MSHNAFVQGFLEHGCDVDILMSADSWGAEDKALARWDKAHYYTFPSVSFADRIRRTAKRVESVAPASQNSNQQTEAASASTKTAIRAGIKRVYYSIFRPDPVYPLDKKWLHTAKTFTSNKPYDLVISNSSPAASHRLVAELIDTGHIRFDRWIQIWEDPWYFDLYGGHSEAIRSEEHFLLQKASEVVYVSPLTLQYQKEWFPDCASKMSFVPLPFLSLKEPHGELTSQKGSFGYFGDYYSQTRNLVPFYEALRESGYAGTIIGDSDIHLSETEKIRVSGRVTLDVLAAIQEKTDVLVHLCNLRGGQIPGKIYHYSATRKPILFILDGTEKEIEMIQSFFEPFHRYCFCRNEKDSVRQAMDQLVDAGKEYTPVQEFSPASVVKQLMENRLNT